MYGFTKLYLLCLSLNKGILLEQIRVLRCSFVIQHKIRAPFLSVDKFGLFIQQIQYPHRDVYFYTSRKQLFNSHLLTTNIYVVSGGVNEKHAEN